MKEFSLSPVIQALEFANYFGFFAVEKINEIKKYIDGKKVCWEITNQYQAKNNNHKNVSYKVFLDHLKSSSFLEFAQNLDLKNIDQEKKIALSILKSIHFSKNSLVDTSKYIALNNYLFDNDGTEMIYNETYKTLIEDYWAAEDFTEIQKILDDNEIINVTENQKIIQTLDEKSIKSLKIEIFSLNNDFPQASTMSAFELILKLKEQKVQIPLFQRNYEWKNHLVEKLLNDILDFDFSNKEPYLYLWAISVLKNAKRNMNELIDGQQRIATVLLILKAAYVQILKNENLFSEASKETIESLKSFFESLKSDKTSFLKRVSSDEKEGQLKEFFQKSTKDLYEQKKNKNENLFLQFAFVNNWLEGIKRRSLEKDFLFLIKKIVAICFYRLAFTLTTQYDLMGSELFEKINRNYEKLTVKILLKNYLFNEFEIKKSNEKELIKKFDDLFEKIETDGKSHKNLNFGNFFKTFIRMLGEEFNVSDSFSSIKKSHEKRFYEKNYELWML